MSYTKANLSSDELFWGFGVELSYIDCSIHSMDDLAKEVDNNFSTAEEIKNVLNCISYDYGSI